MNKLDQSVQSLIVSDSLQPHALQHVRLPCPSPTPGDCSNSCPSSQWCHPTISSVVPFSSCPQSFPASVSFQMSQLFTSGGQSIGVSASSSVLPMNIQDWFPLEWTGLISLQSRGLWRRLSAKELMLLNCGVGEDSWESLELQRDPTSPFWRRSALEFLGKKWC